MAISFATLLSSGTANAGGMQCFKDATVVGVGVGYKEDLTGCPDNASCIYFKYKNGGSNTTDVIGINGGYNLNDYNIGLGYLTLLKTAMLTGSKITGWDHWGSGGTCDDIDEILLTN